MSDDRWALAASLAEVGREVRAAVGRPRGAADAEVVRTAGGDDVFGVDARADEVLVDALRRRCGERWPGTLVLEGFDAPVSIGGAGAWRYLGDPVDGSRLWLWAKRSAYVLLGAGRDAATLADLEVGACVELPTPRAAMALTTWAVRGAGVKAVDDDVHAGGDAAVPVELIPISGGRLDHRFVTVARYAVGTKAAVGAWEDAVLDGLAVYEDPYISTGGLLIEVAAGRQAAVLDPRPEVVPDSMASHPYDLAAWVVAAEAGVVVESLRGGPLAAPLDTATPVAWAAYANEEIAEALRARVARQRAGPAQSSSPSQRGARSTR